MASGGFAPPLPPYVPPTPGNSVYNQYAQPQQFAQQPYGQQQYGPPQPQYGQPQQPMYAPPNGYPPAPPPPGPLNKPLLPPNLHGQAAPWNPQQNYQHPQPQQHNYFNQQQYGPPQPQQQYGQPPQFAPTQFGGQLPPSAMLEQQSRAQMQSIQAFLDGQAQQQPQFQTPQPQYQQQQYALPPQPGPQFNAPQQQPGQQFNPPQQQPGPQFNAPQQPPGQQFNAPQQQQQQPALPFVAPQQQGLQQPLPSFQPSPDGNSNEMVVSPSMVNCAKEIHNILGLVQRCGAILQGPKLPPTSEINVPGLASPVTPPQLEATVQNLMATAGQHMRQLDELIASNNPRFDPELQKRLAQVLVENDGQVPPTL